MNLLVIPFLLVIRRSFNWIFILFFLLSWGMAVNHNAMIVIIIVFHLANSINVPIIHRVEEKKK